MLPYFRKLLGLDTSTNASLPQELVHINQEMYKKSLELSERNRTLLLLRKIDEIILSSITDPSQIAQNVTSILVTEAGFKIASVFAYNKNNNYLKRLAMSRTAKVKEFNDEDIQNFYNQDLSLDDTENMIVKSAVERNTKSSSSISNSLLKMNVEKDSQKIQEAYGIKSVWSYPLVVRDQLAGALVICLSDLEQDVSEYSFDLITRLVQVIGIAIDNATLYNELQDANEKLKALDRLKDEFVSLASHELRTPMTAIKSYLWMTLKGAAGEINDKQRLYIQRAYSSVDRLIKLVNDMLNISRIESGRLTVEMQKVDLLKLNQEVLDEVRPRAMELGVNIILDNSISPPPVFADADKIKEVIFNLVGNSLKFTPKNGSITISFSQKDGFVETKVKDTGSGISSENMPRLFQKFGMLPESYVANKTASGTGLGLYICRSIIEIHKGKIWATSEGEGKGSEFSFTLKIFDEKDLSASVAQEQAIQKENIGIIHTHV